jgi:hypothetical protein
VKVSGIRRENFIKHATTQFGFDVQANAKA